MRIADLARQMQVDVAAVWTAARQIGLPVEDPETQLSNEDVWRLQKQCLAVDPSAVRQDPPARWRAPSGITFASLPPSGIRSGGRMPRKPVPAPSDLARVLLRHDEWIDGDRPRRQRVERAEVEARAWARSMFDAREADRWLTANGGIQPHVAALLRDAGLTPEQAATHVRSPRGFVHRLSLATRVASGELTADEAVEELRLSLPAT